MTEREKMLRGEIYNPVDPEIMALQIPFLDKVWDFNMLRPSQQEEKQRYMRETFAECGERNYIELPMRASWGGANLHLGHDVYINFNLCLVDDGQIYIGSHTMIGPNVTIATAVHPMDPKLRRKGLQFNRDVHIGENVWIASNVVILPGVTIGDNAVIGAGSVVSRDIPAGMLGLGAPCRAVRAAFPEDKV